MPTAKVQARPKSKRGNLVSTRGYSKIESKVKSMVNKLGETKETTHNEINCNEAEIYIGNCQWQNVHGLSLSIGQGTGYNQRVGNTIKIKSLKYQFLVYFPHISTQNYQEPMRACRIMVVQAKRKGTLNELLTLLNGYSGFDAINIAGDPTVHPDFLAEYTLLKDIKVYEPKRAAGNAANDNAIMGSFRLLNKRVKVQATEPIYSVNSNTPDLKGDIFVIAYKHLVTVQSTTNETEMRVGVCSTIRYKDL